MVSAKGKKGGKTCRKCVCKGSVDVLDGMARKGLTEKVTPEQRPERGEVSHAHIWGGVGWGVVPGRRNNRCRGQKQDLWLAQLYPDVRTEREARPSCWPSYSS